MSPNAKPIQVEGTLNTILSPVFTTPYGFKAIFTNIRFNNNADSAWTLWLYQKAKPDTTPFLLYKFDLDSGDVLNDDTVYEIPFQGYLMGLASVDSVQFVINGFLEELKSS